MSPDPTPDVMSALQDLITDWIQEGPYTINGLVERLEASHPDLVSAYVASHRTALAQEMIRRIIGRFRSQQNRLRELENLLTPKWHGHMNPRFLQFPVNDANVWKSLPEMTGADCYYVETQYGLAEASARCRKDFFKTIGTRLAPDQEVQEVFTLEELSALWDQFVTPDTEPTIHDQGDAA